MAANLGQAFLGGAAMVPTIAQELAAGNFPDSRESFHDYIYSKLILGEDKGGNPGLGAPNPPVFPNSNLASSYPNPISTAGNVYAHGAINNMPTPLNHAAVVSKNFSTPTLPKTLTAPTPKPSSSKKKANLTQLISTPQGSADDGMTKVKKKSHHKKKEKTNVCDVCGRGFAEKYTLNRHMLTHTHIKPYSCTKCNMAFSRSDGLAKHMAAGHRRIDAHHCDVCGGTFNSEVSFEQHRREYGNTLPFVCNLCMLAFSQCCHLNYHMKSHSLNKLNDSLGSDSQDDKHEAIDVSELIPEDFSPVKKDSNKDTTVPFLYNPSHLLAAASKSGNKTDLGLLDPNIVIKPEIEDLPTCGAINNQMSSVSGNSQTPSSGNPTFDVLRNLNTVSSSSTLMTLPASSSSQSGNNLTSGNVPTSGASYLPDTSSNLNSSSTGDAPPISEMELKKYFDIKVPNPKLLEGVDLQQPGSGEDNLFRCGLCGKGFTRKYHMQRHVKLHTRGPIPRAHLLDWTRRPYACGVCKMGFTRQHHLTRHMLIHTGERPHSCHVCGKAFRRFTNLSLHVRTVHGAERPFKCHICGRGFPRLYSLQRHHKLHAKHAAGIGTIPTDQLYKGFKAVGTVVDHLDDEKSQGSQRHSPAHSRESISSEHSEDSERYGPTSHGKNAGNMEPSRDTSPPTESEQKGRGQREAGEVTGSHLQSNERQSGMSGHDERLSSQVLQQNPVTTQSSDFMAQHNRMSNQNNQGMRKQSQGQPRNSSELFNSVHQSGESGHGQNQNPGQAHTSPDFTSQQAMQHNERYHPPTSMPNQTMANMDSPVSGNFNQLDMREPGGFSLAQRGNGAESFALAQQRIQSPHSMLNTIERPGSRGMMNPPGMPDKYISTSGNYTQQQPSLPPQQRGSMDLSAVRNTMSPAGLAEQVSFAHSRHVELAVNRGNVGDHPAFPHNHNVSGLQFPGGSHNLYQQQVNENINHMEMHHPNPSASPMPVHTHNNNLQY